MNITVTYKTKNKTLFQKRVCGCKEREDLGLRSVLRPGLLSAL